tara:strand:+ start:3857 stop:5023 length:1167 start_codon:yes stop_codon:yes gene_type:complete
VLAVVKILYHHRVASKDGQHVHIQEIIKSLQKQGHELILVAPRAGENQAFGGDGGVISTLKKVTPKFIYEILEFGYAFIAAAKLLWAVRQHSPDFIYERFNLFTPAGIWVKKIAGVPLVLEVNAPLYEERNEHDGLGLKRLAKWTQAYTWRQADVVLPVTRVLAQQIIAYGVTPSKVHVVHNGINAEEFMGDRPSLKPPIDISNRTVIGFVGFCRKWHGLDKILELLLQPGNEHLFFLLVGDGPAVPALREYGVENGLSDRIHITGVVQRKDMPMWLRPIDIALQPAVVGYASPLKLLEYMATGKAIVAPDQPNIRELLQHEHSALLFQPDNQDDFIRACNRLASDRALRERLAENARHAIVERRLFWDDNAAKIVTLAETFITHQRA